MARGGRYPRLHCFTPWRSARQSSTVATLADTSVSSCAGTLLRNVADGHICNRAKGIRVAREGGLTDVDHELTDSMFDGFADSDDIDLTVAPTDTGPAVSM